MSKFSFEITASDQGARCGEICTARGKITTPVFMPVGTSGAVKAMTIDNIMHIGCEIILANVYHLMIRPGAELVNSLGGLHSFMNWPRPLLTDSGGFQIMSLSKISKINDQEVIFSSHIDGNKLSLSPERSMEIQHLLDADIHMVLDQCIKMPAPRQDVEEAVRRTLLWAERSLNSFVPSEGRGVFAIVQGGMEEDLRRYCTSRLTAMDFNGYAIGGLAVGESKQVMFTVIDMVEKMLPEDKPRYLMGVGTPMDIIGAVLRGVDMFDCVMPTRSGRHGLGFTDKGKIHVRNAAFARDNSVLQPLARCTGNEDSLAYLHHLFHINELTGPILLTWNNLIYYQNLMLAIQQAIRERTINRLVAEYSNIYQS